MNCPVCVLSHVWLFATLWNVAHQAPLFMEISRQEYWNGLPFPTPGNCPNPGTEPISPMSPALADSFLTTEPPGKLWTATFTVNVAFEKLSLKAIGRFVSSDHELPFLLACCYGCAVLNRVQLFTTPWTAARQASLSITNSRVCSNSHPSSQWCHPTISSSVVPFSRLQSFPASGLLQMSHFFPSGGQSTGASASASVLPMNTQDWSPSAWTGWSSLNPRDSLSLLGPLQINTVFFFAATWCQ